MEKPLCRVSFLGYWASPSVNNDHLMRLLSWDGCRVKNQEGARRAAVQVGQGSAWEVQFEQFLAKNMLNCEVVDARLPAC
jgi:hypothetical protein